MDLEMVLNELSLRSAANDIKMAKQRMSELILTAREAAELGVKPIIRTHQEFYNTVLADNYSLSNWLVDKTVNRDDIRFILTAAKTPYLADIQDSDIENKNILSDFLYEGEKSEGLGIAYLLESLALSINSDQKWELNSILLEYSWLEDDNLNLDTVTVTHASTVKNVKENLSWIQERLKTGVRDGCNLWQRKKDLFPSLSFCESVGQQIQSLGNGSPMLRQIVRKLFELENCCKTWRDGDFDFDLVASKVTPESDSRLQSLEDKLTFKCPDDVYRIFSLHLRMTGAGAWRLHFSTELGSGKIIIGYIGPKIQ
jgi:hypothetical protein